MKKFVIIWVGQIISLVGSGMTSFALGVWIYQRTQQATPFALTILFATLPRLLLTPVAGSLADRWNRRWLMILSDTGNALVTLSVIILVTLGNLQIWQIYIIAAVGAVFSAFQEPAYLASISMLVPKEQFVRSSGMISLSNALEGLLAPLLAGVLFTQIGLPGILLIDVGTYFIAVGALMFVDIPQPPAPPARPGKRSDVWCDLQTGWNYLRQRPGLLNLLLYFAFTNFAFNISAVLMTPLVLSNNSPVALGAVQMALGGGLMVGSLLVTTWGGYKRRILNVIWAITLANFGLFIAGLNSSALVIGAGLTLLEFFIPFASSASQAIFLSKVDPGLQGRVFSVRLLVSRSMMPLAYLLSGFLADRIFEPLMKPGGVLSASILGGILGVGEGRGIGLMFILSSLVLWLVTGLAYANPRLRNVEAELPDAVLDISGEVAPVSPQ